MLSLAGMLAVASIAATAFAASSLPYALSTNAAPPAIASVSHTALHSIAQPRAARLLEKVALSLAGKNAHFSFGLAHFFFCGKTKVVDLAEISIMVPSN